MASFDDEAGRDTMITEGSRALELFTDRYPLLRAFFQTMHEDEALGRVLFFHGEGGNGKSLLLRFLREHACKRFMLWQDIEACDDREFVKRLRDDRSFESVPVALLDFHAPVREFEQPTVDYDALLMLRRQLGAFRADGFARLHFPMYDFAAVWYLHKERKLTDDRLHTLFPAEEFDFLKALGGKLADKVPFLDIAAGAFGLGDKYLKERWTLYRKQRKVEPQMLAALMAMDHRDELMLEMPRLFALDLNAALAEAKDDTPRRLVLLLDGHDAFRADSGEEVPFAAGSDRDRWLRKFLRALDLSLGIVPVVTGRRPPLWPDADPAPLPFHRADGTPFLDLRSLGHFTDADADAYFQAALAPTGVDDSTLRARLCDYARVRPDEVHPLYAGLGADVVLQAHEKGHRLTAADFPEEPEAGKKPQRLVERLLKWADPEVRDAVTALAAARAFDRALYLELGKRLDFHATVAAFDTIKRFSFVWEATGRGGEWRSIHALLRRILREYGDDAARARMREADAALEAIYHERAEAGDPVAYAEAIYHAYQQEPKRGLMTWVTVFNQSREMSFFALNNALLALKPEIQPTDPFWLGRMQLEEGAYLILRSRYGEADQVLRKSITTLDEVLLLLPPSLEAYQGRGDALQQLGELYTRVSQYTDALNAFGGAILSYDKALAYDPGRLEVINNKGNTHGRRGELLSLLSKHEEADQDYSAAVVAYEEMIQNHPNSYLGHINKGHSLSKRGYLCANISRHEEAEQDFHDALFFIDKAIRIAPDDLKAYHIRGNALYNKGVFLKRLLRHKDAMQAFMDTLSSYNKILLSLPYDLEVLNDSGRTLANMGDIFTSYSEHDNAIQAFLNAIINYDRVLSLAPNYAYAYSNKGISLQKLGGLLMKLSRYDEGERSFIAAFNVLDEAVRLSPDFPAAYNNKGTALMEWGNSLVNLKRCDEAERAFANAAFFFTKGLTYSPNSPDLLDNKVSALQHRGEMLWLLSRSEAAEQCFTDAAAICDEALQLSPEEPISIANKARLLVMWGLSRQSIGDIDAGRHKWTEALAYAERALALAPAYENALHLREHILCLLSLT